MATCSRCLLSTDIEGVTIDKKTGQCNYCGIHDASMARCKNQNLHIKIAEIKKRAKGKKYDCIVGLSGGFDSSYILYLLVKVFHMKPLVFHFDNGWNKEVAKQNINTMVTAMGVDFIQYGTDNKMLNKLNLAFLKAGVPDCDIPTDIFIHALQYILAEKFKIKTIINGHNFRYEGSVPLAWTYMDAKYIHSVAKKYNVPMEFYSALTFKDQIKYMMKGYKVLRLLDYLDHNKETVKRMLAREYGWIDYGGSHSENLYSDFVTNFLLPKKFDINKKIIHQSAEIRSGKISLPQGYLNSKKIKYDERNLTLITKKLGISMEEIMSFPVTNRDRFESYHKTFKKYRWFIAIATKLGYFPITFLKKYCHE